MKFSPSCGCCYCTRCLIVRDDFDRADSTGLTSWTEDAGDWQIESNELVTSDDNAIARNDYLWGLGFPMFVVSVDLKGDDPGDELDVHVGLWNPASTNKTSYIRVRSVLQNGASCGQVLVYEITDGGEDVIGSQAVPGLVEDAWHRVKVCCYYDSATYSYRYGVEVRTASGVVIRLAGTTDASSSDYVGLGTGNITTKAHFDNFCWQRHRYTEIISGFSPDPGCPHCGGGCDFSEDYFDNTGAGTDMGCAWEECSGNWEIADSGGGNMAATITTAPALLLHTISTPYVNQWVRATGYVKMEDVADILRVWVAKGECLAVTGVAVELEAGADCGVIRLIDSDGSQIGGDVPVDNLTADEWHLLEVCYGTGIHEGGTVTTMLSAVLTTASGNVVRIADNTSGSGGTSAAFEAVDVTTKIWFRDWGFASSYDATNTPNCDPCVDADGWCTWGALFCDSRDDCYWVDAVGTWTNCSTTSSDDAIKRYDLEHPYRVPWMRMVGTVSSTGQAEAIAYISYKDATTNLALAFYFEDATCPKICLLEDGVIIRTVLDHRLTSGKDIDFCVQYDGSELSAWYRHPGSTEEIYLESDATASADGIKAAIGTKTVTTGAITFSNILLYVSKHQYSNCDDCDECTTWYDNDFSGTLNDPLSCDYDGTAVYDNIVEFSGGVNIDVAKVPSGGTLSFDVGTSGISGVGYVSFVLTELPATLTFTVLGIVAVLTVDADTTATLEVGDSDPYDTTVTADTLWTLQVCALGNGSQASLRSGGLTANVHASATGDGTLSGSTIEVAASVDDVHVKTLVASRYLKNDGTGCAGCPTYCEPCLDNTMPSQILIEIEDCVADPFYDPCCDGMYGGGGLSGAFYVPMVECTGGASYGLLAVGGDPRSINITFTDNGTTVTVTVSWYFQKDYPTVGENVVWSSTFAKPIACQTMDRLELALDTLPTTCAGALANATCYISGA